MVLTIVLSAIIIFSLFLTFAFNKAISIIFSSYWRTVIVSLFVLIYSIIVMWVPGIYQFINNQTSDVWIRSNNYSGALLLQLPCLMCIVLPLTLIFDKSKNIAKAIAPFMIVYCLMNYFIRFLGYDSIIIDVNQTTWYEYVFFGEKSDRMFFLSNFFVLFLSCFTYISAKTYTKYSFCGGLLILAIVMVYYLLVKSLAGVNACISGLGAADWIQIGSYLAMYKPISNIFGSISTIGYVWVFNIWFLIYLFFTFILVILKNFLTVNPIKISLVNEPWYKKSTFLKGFLSPFDAAINNLINTIIPYGYFYPEKLKKLKLKNFKYYYNKFIALSSIEQYERTIDDLEYQLSNRKFSNNSLIVRQKIKVDKAKEIKKMQEFKLEELQREIDEELKQVDCKKALRENKKMERKLKKEAKKNNVVIEKNKTYNDVAESGAL